MGAASTLTNLHACKDRFFLESNEMSVALEQKMEAADPVSAWILEAGEGQLT
ncbi:hypothetical protein N8D56_08835 [Devosia sp. A8/3-2]|nr:hypothetical protein N8D56_08835 [Devosia sp. A8/3-2]